MQKKKIFIIAEAGVNHNGDLKKALKLIKSAKDCGADAIKFQSFKTRELVTDDAKTCNYQNKKKYINQKALLQRLEIKKEDFLKLNKYSKQLGIEFMSTAFDSDSLNFLTDTVKIRRIKIASGDLVNPIILYKASLSNLPIILSTGM